MTTIGPVAAVVVAGGGFLLAVMALHQQVGRAGVLRRLRGQRALSTPMPTSTQLIGTAALISCTIALLAGSPVVAVVITLAGSVAVLVWRDHRRLQASGSYARELPLVLDDLARTVSGGGTAQHAMRDAASRWRHVGSDLAVVADMCVTGAPLRRALDEWTIRTPTVDVRMAVAALTLSLDTGASHAATLDAVAASLRSRLRMHDLTRTYSTQARLSAYVLVALPVVFSVLLVLLNQPARIFLFHSSGGPLVLVVGATLDGLGLAWMLSLMRRTKR